MSRPNILLIVPDTLPRTALRVYGGANPAATPNLDRVFDGGVVFSRAYCTTPQCTPAKASLLTGRLPHRAKMVCNVKLPAGRPFDTDIPSIGKHFRECGYATGLFGNCHQGVPHDCGNAFGFDVLQNEYAIGRDDTLVTAHCTDFIEGASVGSDAKPWFAAAFYHQAHDISHFRSLDDEALNELEREAAEISLPESVDDRLIEKPAEQRKLRDAQRGKMPRAMGHPQWRAYIEFHNRKIAGLDEEVGRLFVILDHLDLWKDTIVVVIADHGDLGSAHGLAFKGGVMYEEVTGIPFALRWDGVIPARTAATPAHRSAVCSGADVFPTLADLAGIESPSGVDGTTLAGVVADGDEVLERRSGTSILLEYHGNYKVADGPLPSRCLVTASHKYNRYLSGNEELYDLLKDPFELDNLAFRTPEAPVLNEMRRRLDRRIAQTNDRLFLAARKADGVPPNP